MLAAVVKEFGGPNVIKVLSNVPIPKIESSDQVGSHLVISLHFEIEFLHVHPFAAYRISYHALSKDFHTTSLVRVAASGVNPVDTYIRNGQYAAKPNLPYSPGKDGAGVVAKVSTFAYDTVGADVRDVKKGDRVYFAFSLTGSAAEYCLADRVFPLPPGNE
ncbi:GroES-like protein [Ostertagia ostertagi]